MTAEPNLIRLEKNGLAEQDVFPDDERIIGGSFNIATSLDTTKKYIPRNKLHRVMAAHENIFRTMFYMVENPKFAIDYEFITARNILIKQGKKKTIEGNFKEIPLLNSKNFTYPNFAMATLSYIENGKVINQVIKVNNDVAVSGHSEEQIFSQVRNFKLLQEKKYIVLDIHSTLSMCKDCFKKAKKLMNEFEDITFVVNVSYLAQYLDSEEPEEIPNKLFQRQIELIFMNVNEPLISKGSLVTILEYFMGSLIVDDSITLDTRFIDNTFFSNCYKNHKINIDYARNLLKVQNGILEQELITKDEKNGEEFLSEGESFNYEISGTNQWIPRNKLHRVLATHENTFRTIFLMSNLYKSQISPMSRLINLTNRIADLNKQQNLNLKKSQMQQIFVNDFKDLPNFSLATMGYVKGVCVIAEIVKIEEQQSVNKDGVELIFDHVSKIYIDKFKDPEIIILDVHSTYNMSPDCYKKAEKLVKKFQDRGKTFIINLSYFFEKEGIITSNNIIIQKQLLDLKFIKNIDEPRGSLAMNLEFFLSHPVFINFKDSIVLDWKLIDAIVMNSDWAACTQLARDQFCLDYKLSASELSIPQQTKSSSDLLKNT